MPVQLNPLPFQNIGSTLAGGAVLPAALEEAKGENLGANTQRAIAEANAQFAKNKALADPALASKLAAVNGGSPELGEALAGLNRAGVNPEQEFAAIAKNQETGSHVTVANPDAQAPARIAAAQSLSPAGLANPLSDARQQLITAQAANTSAGIPGSVRLQNAKAALAEAQASHPELFHPTSALNMPADPAKLRALYQLGVLDPGTANRASISGPAVNAAYAAAFPEDVQPAPGAAPAAPAAPGAAPAAAPAAGPGNLPALQPGGNAHAEIRQSDMQFASMKPNDPGGKIAAGNKLTAHLGLLQQLHDAQSGKNVDMPTLQRAFTALTGQAGSDVPTMNRLASHFVGDEMTAFLANNNGALEDRNKAQANFNGNDIGADQLQSNITLGRELMGGQFAGLKKGYSAPSARTDAQVKNFGTKYLLDPTVLSDWEAKHGEVTRGAPLPQAPGSVPATTPAAAPAPIGAGPAPIGAGPAPAAAAAPPAGGQTVTIQQVHDYAVQHGLTDQAAAQHVQQHGFKIAPR